MPMVSYVGRQPTSTVEMPISSSVMTSDTRRPSLSPMCPKMMPPSGRTRNATAKVANAAAVSARGSPLGKKRGPNTSAAAVA